MTPVSTDHRRLAARLGITPAALQHFAIAPGASADQAEAAIIARVGWPTWRAAQAAPNVVAAATVLLKAAPAKGKPSKGKPMPESPETEARGKPAPDADDPDADPDAEQDQRCEECDEKNDARAKYCDGCGAPLAGGDEDDDDEDATPDAKRPAGPKLPTERSTASAEQLTRTARALGLPPSSMPSARATRDAAYANAKGPAFVAAADRARKALWGAK